MADKDLGMHVEKLSRKPHFQKPKTHSCFHSWLLKPKKTVAETFQDIEKRTAFPIQKFLDMQKALHDLSEDEMEIYEGPARLIFRLERGIMASLYSIY